MAATAELGPPRIEVMPSLSLGGFVSVRYVLPSSDQLRVGLYDVSGRLMAARRIAVGRSGTATLDLRGLASGVYLVRLAASGLQSVQKVVLTE
jgi:hypothetical protein